MTATQKFRSRENVLDRNTVMCATSLASLPMVETLARKAWVWTPERRKAVQEDIVPGRTAREVAELHGLPVRAVTNAFQRGKLVPIRTRESWSRPTVQVIDLVSRKCLSCQEPGMFEPGIFRCDPCRARGSRICEMVGA